MDLCRYAPLSLPCVAVLRCSLLFSAWTVEILYASIDRYIEDVCLGAHFVVACILACEVCWVVCNSCPSCLLRTWRKGGWLDSDLYCVPTSYSGDCHGFNDSVAGPAPCQERVNVASESCLVVSCACIGYLSASVRARITVTEVDDCKFGLTALTCSVRFWLRFSSAQPEYLNVFVDKSTDFIQDKDWEIKETGIRVDWLHSKRARCGKHHSWYAYSNHVIGTHSVCTCTVCSMQDSIGFSLSMAFAHSRTRKSTALSTSIRQA